MAVFWQNDIEFRKSKSSLLINSCYLDRYKYDIETQELTLLNDDNYYIGIRYINYLVNNNYLFAKYACNIDMYYINQDKTY